VPYFSAKSSSAPLNDRTWVGAPEWRLSAIKCSTTDLYPNFFEVLGV
jgi:hypothetical protein